jgi:hypothetical protein
MFFKEYFPYIRDYILDAEVIIEDNPNVGERQKGWNGWTYKEGKTKKVSTLAREVMPYEFKLISEGICKVLYEEYGIKSITVHDAIYMRKSDAFRCPNIDTILRRILGLPQPKPSSLFNPTFPKWEFDDESKLYQYQFNLTINTWESPQMTLASTAIDTWEDGEEQSGVMSGTISFPDAAFKASILGNCLFGKDENGNIDMGNVVSESIDVNDDGEISSEEANAVYHLTIQNVTNLSGLEYFANLEYLVITGSSISSIDLSGIPSLMFLDFMSNSGVESLIFSNNPNLKRIGCGNNSQLKTLDISGAPSLEELACNDNAIEVLDVSNNPALSTVRLNSESGLQTLYVSSTQNTEGWSLPEGVTPIVKGE